jgi:O-antigen ligase
VLIWSLVIFGGVYAWSAWPAVIACLVLAAFNPPAFRRETRAVDLALVCVGGVLVMQLLPLPRGLVAHLSPASVQLQETLRLDAGPRFMTTLSISPSDTAYALAVTTAALLLFWTARETFRFAGIRTVARAVAASGLLVAAVAIAQHATGTKEIYWFWQPIWKSARPFGPFVNRNHFATWVVLAIPFCLGYFLARFADRADTGRRRRGVLAGLDGRTVWLATACFLMALALALSVSRSGIAALAVALLSATFASRGRLAGRQRVTAAAGLGLALLAVVYYSDVPAIARRVGETMAPGGIGRVSIWRESIPVLRDFPLMGSGAGTYQVVMLAYQTSDRAYYINQAHNHYLQVAAEGGIALALPVAFGLAAFVGLARARLAGDRSGVYWLRLGAATGLVAVAVQSIWETGLTAPANGLLAAVLAAVVVHEPYEPVRDAPAHDRRRPDDERGAEPWARGETGRPEVAGPGRGAASAGART